MTKPAAKTAANTSLDRAEEIFASLNRTIREYWNERSDSDGRCPITEYGDGWRIEQDEDGRLVLLSPGTTLRELSRTECEGGDWLAGQLAMYED